MQAGKLRHRITIQQRATARDAIGGQSTSWETFATVWGEALPVRGREFVSLRVAQSDISVRFNVRYLAGITPAMRVQWDDNAYGIVEVINVDGRNMTLELLCRGPAQES